MRFLDSQVIVSQKLFPQLLNLILSPFEFICTCIIEYGAPLGSLCLDFKNRPQTHHHHKHISYMYYTLCSSTDLTLTFEWVLAKLNLIGNTSFMKLFHANLSSAKRLAASHSNPMSNSFIFIMEIMQFAVYLLAFLFASGNSEARCQQRCHLKDEKDDQVS